VSGTVTWPGGIDLAPEPLYEQAHAHPLVAAYPPGPLATGLGGTQRDLVGQDPQHGPSQCANQSRADLPNLRLPAPRPRCRERVAIEQSPTAGPTSCLRRSGRLRQWPADGLRSRVRRFESCWGRSLIAISRSHDSALSTSARSPHVVQRPRPTVCRSPAKPPAVRTKNG
jgi:hypothetical protein